MVSSASRLRSTTRLEQSSAHDNPRAAAQPFSLPNISLEQAGISSLLVVVGVSAIGTYFSPEERYYRQQEAIGRAEQGERDLAKARDIAEREELERRLTDERAIADDRYSSACTVLAVEQSPGVYKLIALSAEVDYIDTALTAMLSPGEIVCDDNGMTAVMGAGGLIQDQARSGNAQLINTRIADAYGWAGQVIRSTPGR